MSTTIGKLKEGQTFTVGDLTVYYVRRKYDRGLNRYHCDAYTVKHARYKWLDRAYKKNQEVTKYEPK